MANEEIKKEEKLSKRDFILVIVAILLLSGATYWNFKSWRKSLKEVELPKFEMPKFEPFPKKEGYKEFTSPDGKITFRYPADWTEIDFKAVENVFQKEIEEKPLFFAQKFLGGIDKIAFMTVEETSLDERKNPEEVIEQIKTGAAEKGGEAEILTSEIQNNEMVIEIKYKNNKGLLFHSIEKLFFMDKTYSISLLSGERDWPEFEKEAEEIINSIQILK